MGCDVGAVTLKPLVVPQFGVIRGGRCDGWKYTFLWFKAAPTGLLVCARVSAPNWPFPCDMDLIGGRHFSTLRAIPGSRAKRLNATNLIASAYKLEGKPAPAWLFDAPPKTIRGAVREAARRRSRP